MTTFDSQQNNVFHAMTDAQVRDIAGKHGTPVLVYSEDCLKRSADEALAFPNAFGLTVRYAMKAIPTAAVLQLFNRKGIHIDASSGYEVERAIIAGIAPEQIQLTSQELPENFAELVEKGVSFNACSLSQLEAFAQRFPGAECSVRLNPGIGSGHNNRTNVGGPASSFGIWFEYLPKVLEIAAAHNVKITGIHTHIGSGSDPEVWVKAAHLALDLVRQIGTVHTLSLGGGYKVARIEGEKTADLQNIGGRVKELFVEFNEKHNRQIHLEVEPGSYLVTNAGTILSRVMDVIDTGDKGFNFIKINSGMTDILRVSLYGAQHPLKVVTREEKPASKTNYVVVGHCCESGDIITSQPGDPEGIKEVELETAAINDYLLIGGAGAYCASMASKNYNSFPESPEVMLMSNGDVKVIKQKQSLQQVLTNEVTNLFD